MILSVPIAKVNTVVLSNGVFVPCVYGFDLHFVESFKKLSHEICCPSKVSIRHDPPGFLAPANLFLMIA